MVIPAMESTNSNPHPSYFVPCPNLRFNVQGSPLLDIHPCNGFYELVVKQSALVNERTTENDENWPVRSKSDSTSKKEVYNCSTISDVSNFRVQTKSSNEECLRKKSELEADSCFNENKSEGPQSQSQTILDKQLQILPVEMERSNGQTTFDEVQRRESQDQLNSKNRKSSAVGKSRKSEKMSGLDESRQDSIEESNQGQEENSGDEIEKCAIQLYNKFYYKYQSFKEIILTLFLKERKEIDAFVFPQEFLIPTLRLLNSQKCASAEIRWTN